MGGSCSIASQISVQNFQIVEEKSKPTEESMEENKEEKKKPKYSFQKKKNGASSSSSPSETPKSTSLSAFVIDNFLQCEWIELVESSGSNLNGKEGLGTENEGREGLGVASVHSKAMVDTQIIGARRMTAENSEKTVVEIRLKPLSSFHFEPGDSIGIIPNNIDKEVEELCQLINLSSHARFRLKKLKEKKMEPHILLLLEKENLEVGKVIKQWLDIRSPPKKALLRLLSHRADNESEKTELLNMCESSRYLKEVIQSGVTLSDLLKRFPSSKPSLSDLLEELPALTPRYYSLSSSPSSPYLSIIYTVIVQPRPGLCSSFLSDLCKDFLFANSDENERQKMILPIFLRSAPSFKLPIDNESNIIMIGAGTGVAPFMSFIQHRAESSSSTSGVPHSWLFFGCRREEEDFLYGDELLELAKKGSLSKLIPAFSRKETGAKTYVQHKLIEHKEEIWSIFFQDKAHLFICGDGFGMAKGVMEALARILSEKSDITHQEALERIKELKKEGKISTDVWG